MKSHEELRHVAISLLQVVEAINEQSSDSDIIYAAEKIIGLTTANTEVRIEDYEDKYPVLDDIDAIANVIDIREGGDYRELWLLLEESIQKFYNEVNESKARY